MTDHTVAPDHITVRHQQLHTQAAALLHELITPGSRCALVDFPMHANVGDSAIWLGERTLLSELGADLTYVTDLRSYSESTLAKRVPAGTGTILLHGGGNLGDLWPHHQRLRERVLTAFPDRRVIQLPQSIHFNNPANLDRARAVFDGHPNLTLLVRDHLSLAVAHREFQARSLLCPDLAFGINRPPHPHRAHYPVLWLSRTDHEAALRPLPSPGPGIWRTDWTASEGADHDWTTRLHTVQRELSTTTPPPMQRLIELYDRHAQLHLQRGCRLLTSGRVVVTDRLHAHLLSLLLGQPHILLEDRHAKIRGFWETWTSDWLIASWGSTPQQALKQALTDAVRGPTLSAATPNPPCARSH